MVPFSNQLKQQEKKTLKLTGHGKILDMFRNVVEHNFALFRVNRSTLRHLVVSICIDKLKLYYFIVVYLAHAKGDI